MGKEEARASGFLLRGVLVDYFGGSGAGAGAGAGEGAGVVPSGAGAPSAPGSGATTPVTGSVMTPRIFAPAFRAPSRAKTTRP